MDIIAKLCAELGVTRQHAQNVAALLDDGNTVPFISRYRKEMTGSMDDQKVRELSERLAYLRSLDARRAEVKESINSQQKLTDELALAIDAAETLAEVEDLYRPYRPKRRTRASIARERGLEPLAEYIFAQEPGEGLAAEAEKYIGADGIESVSDALCGARDIIAENISDDADIRKALRALIYRKGSLVSHAAKDSDSVYAMYYDYSEPLRTVQGHRILALNRGEREGFLSVSIELARPEAVSLIRDAVVTGDNERSEQVKLALEDSYDRLIFPSVEREMRAFLTDGADESAIRAFALNLKPLLMQPPVKNRVTLGLDPAYRTGCKIAVVDGTGRVLDTAVIYPTPPHNKTEEAAKTLKALIKKHNVEMISIGNGTASRESEKFVAELIKGTSLSYMIVSEAGASVYSASKLAAAEFPEYDVSLRSAVSIARRLQDPLAELVKIDPKALGVGQYQHDMPAARLDEALGGVVEDCVNAVGVDLNTASPSLLSHIAGINMNVAKSIVSYREEKGAFSDRRQLLKVAKLGEKTFVQCAGFIRVAESRNVFDNTGVHPESYDAAKMLLTLCGYDENDVKSNSLGELDDRVKKLGLENAAARCNVGVPTLEDIIKELQKPGRDPRDELPPPILRSDVLEMKDLQAGMELKGTVRNVVDFGCFVDIGVHQDGLVHISQLCDRYVKHPSDVVKTGDVVTVWVLEVNEAKNRISLTMKKPPETK